MTLSQCLRRRCCTEIHYKIQNSQICEIADEFWNNVNEQNYGKINYYY